MRTEICIGILVTAGSEETCIKLQTIAPGACLSLLDGLEGAIKGKKWNITFRKETGIATIL